MKPESANKSIELLALTWARLAPRWPTCWLLLDLARGLASCLADKELCSTQTTCAASLANSEPHTVCGRMSATLAQCRSQQSSQVFSEEHTRPVLDCHKPQATGDKCHRRSSNRFGRQPTACPALPLPKEQLDPMINGANWSQMAARGLSGAHIWPA